MLRAPAAFVLTAAVALGLAGAASAQTGDAPRPARRIIPVPTPRPPDPAPRATPVPVSGGRLTLGGLAGLPSADEGGTTCRTGCARVRYVCEVGEDACASSWRVCLKGCTDAQASRPSALLPR